MAENVIDEVIDLAGDLKEKGPRLIDDATKKIAKMGVGEKASDFAENYKRQTRRCYRLGGRKN
jgi:hypothetical protein